MVAFDSTLHRVSLTKIHTALGQRSKLLSSYQFNPGASNGSRVRVRGNAFILNGRWSSKFIEHSYYDSELYLVYSISITVSTGKLRVVATYKSAPYCRHLRRTLSILQIRNCSI